MTDTQWSENDLEILKKEYPDQPCAAVAATLGKSKKQVYAAAHKYGIKKSESFKASHLSGRLTGTVGTKTRFQKNAPSWNAGIKIGTKGNSVKTQFKSGQKPPNYKPVGSQRTTGDGILQVKVSDTGYPPDDWKSVHSELWKKHNGEIPDGSVVIFRNGNKTDIRIENLALVTRVELIKHNSIMRYPPEVRQVMRTVGIIKREIRNKEKENG